VSVPQPTVGFIGLGDIGGPMALRIVGAGYPTVLWARRPEAMAEYSRPGVQRAASPSELAARSDLVGICVMDGPDVESVLGGPDGVLAGLRPGTVVAVHSTIGPRACIEAARLVGARSADLLDAPVSGGSAAAASGELLLILGGEAAVVERATPVFSTFAGSFVHVGAVGMAQLVKLLNNTLLTAGMALADEALELGEGLGLDPAVLGETLLRGTARSFALEVTVERRTTGGRPEKAVALLGKDVDLLLAAVDDVVASDGLLGAAARRTIARLRSYSDNE
jgi:3-hydroxyisobutyrate dehydrogenase